jgi:hypothetical protein
MRKIIPILVVLAFLMVGFFNINFGFFGIPNFNDETDSDIKLPYVDETLNDVVTVQEPSPSGSRFMVTTRTSIILDSPKPYQGFEHMEKIIVSGNLFEDNNSNGEFDAGEDIPVELGTLKLEFGDHLEDLETDAEGNFYWDTENTFQIKGLRDLNIRYDGQYTINGSEWFDVDTSKNGNGRLGYNDDNDFYIDVELYYNTSSSSYEYRFPGDGKFTPGVVNETAQKRVGGDVIIRDTGQRGGTWDSGDTIVRDPLNEGDDPYGFDDQIMNYYQNPGTPGRVDFVPLIDEERPQSFDQSIMNGSWVDEDGDWDAASNDVGEDGQGGTNDNGEGDGKPTPGEPFVDEDLNFTKFRKESNVTIFVALWHNTEIDAVVLNSTGKQTNRATVGDTITIKGTLRNIVNPSIKPADKHLKLKIFGTLIPDTILTDNKGEFSYEYTISTNPVVRVGKRNIDIMFDDKQFDPDYNLENESHEYFVPTSLSTQESGPLVLRIYRPIHIVFEKPEYVAYRFKSFSINATLMDDNNKPLYSTIVHDDGTSESITTNAYRIQFEWGRQVDKFYDYREEDLLDPSGNFTIPAIEINDPDQVMGDIPVRFTIIANHSQTYYLTVSQAITVTVRSKGAIELWIDQDADGFKNEDPNNMKGKLADYITRTKFIDKDGNQWNFNNVVVYGRLSYKERPDEGIDNKNIQYYWDDEATSWEDAVIRSSKTATQDYNLNGRREDDEEGRFIIPDPNQISDPPKIIEPSHPLGPITLHARYDDPGDYINAIEVQKEFSVVAMTRIRVVSGGGVKGENLTINGYLLDDMNRGVPTQEVNLYWEDLQGDLLVGDKYDPIKLADAHIGNVTTDSNGYFSFYSERVLKRDVDVGKGFVVAIFDGSVPPYTDTNAYIGTSSEEMPFNVSSNTRVELSENSKNLKLIRGKSFFVDGTIYEVYQGDKNIDAKVILGIADVDQMELYIKNIEGEEETRITDVRVEYKSEGKFTVSGTVPFNLDVGSASLRLVFKGSKNGNYLGDAQTTFHEIWADTVIKILAPEVRVKEIEEEGYVLSDDIYQNEYDIDSGDFIEPGLVFRFQLLEQTEGAEPKPVSEGKIKLTINSSYSVFTNYSIKYSDTSGMVNFTFDKPLTDTDWGYTLARTDPEELIITVEFSGKDYYLSSKTLPIQTTHWPPQKEDPPVWDDLTLIIWIVVVIVIVFLVIFFFAMRWYTKQQRIRGMRRIIKRAADQLIAGNEYQAVIFKSYQKLGVHLRKYGYLRRDSETFREFEDAVRSALPIDRISMDKFLMLLEEARYSSHQIGEGQRNDAILNLRAIERSLDRIIIDEDAALRALERLETEGVKETKIVLGGKPKGPSENVPHLLKGVGGPKKQP